MNFVFSIGAFVGVFFALLFAIEAGRLIDTKKEKAGRYVLVTMGLMIGAVGLGYLAGAA